MFCRKEDRQPSCVVNFASKESLVSAARSIMDQPIVIAGIARQTNLRYLCSKFPTILRRTLPPPKKRPRIRNVKLAKAKASAAAEEAFKKYFGDKPSAD